VFLLFPMLVVASQLKDHLTPLALVVVAVAVLLLANIETPETNTEFLKLLLNQRPLIAMIVMAAFLAIKLKSNRHVAVAKR